MSAQRPINTFFSDWTNKQKIVGLLLYPFNEAHSIHYGSIYISKTKFKDSPFPNQHTASSSRNHCQLYFKHNEISCCGHTHFLQLKRFFSGSNKHMNIKNRYLILFASHTKQTNCKNKLFICFYRIISIFSLHPDLQFSLNCTSHLFSQKESLMS